MNTIETRFIQYVQLYHGMKLQELTESYYVTELLFEKNIENKSLMNKSDYKDIYNQLNKESDRDPSVLLKTTDGTILRPEPRRRERVESGSILVPPNNTDENLNEDKITVMIPKPAVQRFFQINI